MSALPKLSEKDRAVLNSIFNPSLPLGEEIPDEFAEELNETASDERDSEELIKLEISAVKCAEEKKYFEALEIFEKIIKLSLERAASYNNRAQVYRLLGDNNAALVDLNKAIELSDKIGKTYKQALCQRGIIYKKEGKEMEAKEDFSRAAKLGSPFAKQQLIDMNPYAALCNQMLSQVMQQL